MHPNEGKKTWCSWPVAIVFLLSFVVSCVLLLIFAPIERGVAKVIPNFEPTETQLEWIVESSPTSAPTKAGGQGEEEQYQFMQCEDASSECCNGHKLNCGLRLNEMIFATVHNAMHTRESSGTIGYNHLFNLDGALEAGFRGLNLDVCKCGGQTRFCHGFCEVGNRDPAQVFLEIMRFLMSADYLTEVIVLIFQFSTGDPTVADLYGVMQDVAGLAELMYVHNTNEPQWPTMRELLVMNKRIIVFQHEGADCSTGGCPPVFHDFFDYTADTAYEFASVNALRNYGTSCLIGRGPKTDATFFNVNSFVTPPSEDAAKTINEKASIETRLDKCSAITGLAPNFITVDFWSKGDVPEVAQVTNIARAQSTQR